MRPCFTSISLKKVCSGLFHSTVVFFLHILPFLISSSSFDGSAWISQEDCASITSRSLRVQALGFAFYLLGLCMWKSPCCTYYSALLIRCEIKGDFEELKELIHYVLWSGNAKQQLTHAFKEDCNPTFKPFPVRQTPHPPCSENHPDDEIYETA